MEFDNVVVVKFPFFHFKESSMLIPSADEDMEIVVRLFSGNSYVITVPYSLKLRLFPVICQYPIILHSSLTDSVQFNSIFIVPRDQYGLQMELTIK